MSQMKRTTPKPYFLSPTMSYENLIDPDLPEPGAVYRATSGFIINAFNNNSEGPKLRFTMSTAVGPGVGLQYRLD